MRSKGNRKGRNRNGFPDLEGEIGPASSPGTGSAGTNTTCLQQWASAVNRYRLDRNKLPGDKNNKLQSAVLSIRGRNLLCECVESRITTTKMIQWI